MKLSQDYRALARAALRGRWMTSVVVCLLAAFMGAAVFGEPTSLSVSSSVKESVQGMGTLESAALPFDPIPLALILGLIAVTVLVVRLVIGGAATLGLARYDLDVIDGKESGVSTLFSNFYRLWDGFCLQFLRSLYTLLWGLLLVFPAIIAEHRYAMAPFIMAEHPEMSAGEAIDASKELMRGNKFRLFCLSFSFIGWHLLCSVPATVLGGIAGGLFVMTIDGTAHSYLSALSVILPAVTGVLLSAAAQVVLRPYIEVSYAAFYRDISAVQPAYSQTQVYESYDML